MAKLVAGGCDHRATAPCEGVFGGKPMLRCVSIAAITAASVILFGCASAQLNYNTIDLASSSSRLITSQVLYNLAQFRSSPFAIPAQVSIPSGSATTTNSVTPTISVPLTSSLTTVIANSAAAPAFFSTSNTHAKPNGTIGGSVADQWSQNWTVTPLDEPDQLLRLRAIYRYGAGLIDRAEFTCEYPLVQENKSSGGSGQQSVNININGVTASAGVESNKPANSDEYSYKNAPCKSNIGTPDPSFLKLPTCIICEYPSDQPKPPKKPKPISVTGDLSSSTISVKGTSAPLTTDLIGATVTGYCIKASTVISAINDDPLTIELSQGGAACPKKGGTFFIARQQQPAAQQYVLDVNHQLTNRWLWNPECDGPLLPGSPPLGHYAGEDLYLNPGPASEFEYSNFVVFVLEATTESTATSGGATSSGKGTPQKAGATPLQQPARSEFILE
jgi:hypothetical protein